MQTGNFTRALGLKESIAMTVGTVVGVGLFTCGSAQIGFMGTRVIGMTLLALLISIWPSMLYGEMAAAMPGAGGTYNFARKGIGRLLASIAGWNYIISVVAIGSGEALAFSNYFSLLLEQFGLDMSGLDHRVIAVGLVLVFMIINYFGIKSSGKVQMLFIVFFWACTISWFLYMIPNVHMEYFGRLRLDELPSFEEQMYIFGLIWWCYTGFETCVSMGSETKYPQYTLPRALKISIFMIFACNALFQWFLCGVVNPENYGILTTLDAPYAEGLKMAGLVGFPIIMLCITIAFGGDLSAINPSIAAPARYLYSMAQDKAIPGIFGKLHPKYNVPHVSLIFIGVVCIFLIITDSIVYIASVSLIALGICYIIGCMSYIGLRKKFKDMIRPYKAPRGVFGACLTIVLYIFMLCFADKSALITTSVISLVCVAFWFFFSRKKAVSLPEELYSTIAMEEPSAEEKRSMDRQYHIWMAIAVVLCLLAIALFTFGILTGKGII